MEENILNKITTIPLKGSQNLTLNMPRCYTLSYDNLSDHILVGVGRTYNHKQFNPFYQTLLANWIKENDEYTLHIYYLNNNSCNSLRSAKNKEEADKKTQLIVDSIQSADKEFFDKNPQLSHSNVRVHFQYGDFNNASRKAYELNNFRNTPSSYREITDDWYKVGRDPSNSFHLPSSLPLDLSIKHRPIIKGNSPWAIINDILYVTDSKDSKKLYAIDLNTNTIKWEFTSDGDYPINYVMANANGVFVVNAKKKKYYAFMYIKRSGSMSRFQN